MSRVRGSVFVFEDELAFVDECFRSRMTASVHRVAPTALSGKAERSHCQTAFWWRIDVERSEQRCTAGVRPHCTIVR